MKVRFIILSFVLIGVLLATTQCSTPATTNPPAQSTSAPASTTGGLDGQALFQSRCSTCHSLNRSQNVRHTASEWKVVVQQMVQAGAQLNADEQQAVIDYLAKTYPK